MIAAIGWTIVHSLWQWTLVGGLAALILGLLPRARAQTRYAVGCAALAAMMLAALVTGSMALLTVDAPLRHRALYAFDGALIMPEVFAHGASILRLAAVLWLLGLGAGIGRLAIEWRRVRRLRSHGLSELDQVSAAAVAELIRDMGIERPVNVQHSALAAVPMVLGWRRPHILLPAGSAGLLTSHQRRAILAHELGHVRRGDFVANLLQAVVDVTAFHHPAARWLSRSVRTEREFACDDMAVAVTRDVRAYAHALAALEDARADCRLAVAAASGTLLDRVQRLAGTRQRVFTPVRGALACAGAMIVAAALFTLSLNMPPPWLPSGIRIRRPPPPGVQLPQLQGDERPRGRR
jgi:beta-lactamase regulating signal transducer with metallopeptidase domain